MDVARACAAVAAAILVAATACGGSDGSEGSAPGDEMDRYLRASVAQDLFSGAVLVAKEGEVLLEAGYGEADRERRIPNTPTTQFRIGSVSKQFTALAILQLQDRGALGVRDSICMHLPRCPPDWRHITIHDLLTHKAGVQDRPFENRPLDRVVDDLRTTTLEFRPGTSWRYCNSCYLLAGAIVEHVSGQTWLDYLRDHVFEPTEMSATEHDEESPGRRAIGYELGSDARAHPAPYRAAASPDPAGGIKSTVGDLYRYDQRLNGTALASKQALEAVFTPDAATEGGRWGYGWIIDRKLGRRVIEHGGSINGWRSLFSRYPDDELTVIVLGNSSWSDALKIGDDLARIALGLPYRFPDPPRTIEVPRQRLRAYAGSYESPEHAVAIDLSGGRLILDPAPLGGADVLLPLSKDVFIAKHDPELTLRFTRGVNDRAVRLRMENDRMHFVARLERN